MTIRVTDDMHDVRFVVCQRADAPSPWPDNVRGLCSRCGVVVVHRPHVPPNIPLLCLSCYVRDEQGGHEVVVSPQSVREVVDEQLRGRRN